MAGFCALWYAVFLLLIIHSPALRGTEVPDGNGLCSGRGTVFYPVPRTMVYNPPRQIPLNCEEDGTFRSLQCDDNGICKCVNEYGNVIARTITPRNRDPPVCEGLKPGHCPIETATGDSNHFCVGDADCPSTLKCCDTEQGKTCLHPKQECYYEEFVCADGLTCVPEMHICDGFPDCPDGDDENQCNEPYFECAFGRKIHLQFRCDGTPHCLDGSDEADCDTNQHEYRFFCKTYHGEDSIGKWEVCDLQNNCVDGSDEEDCPCDREGQFMCKDGSKCITTRKVCSGYIDCADGSDESDETCDLRSCQNSVLIPSSAFCNGIDDCGDNSDEIDCGEGASHCGNERMTRCSNGRCIHIYEYCNSYFDCSDESDEMNCPCVAPNHECSNGLCVPRYGLCDGIESCPDGSDEKVCNCHMNYFECGDGSCISKWYTCNGDNDCSDGSDEDAEMCACKDYQFTCGNGRCVGKWWVCDGDPDCSDWSDEMNCPTEIPEYYNCDDGQLAPKDSVCNRRLDCNDGSDERDCPCRQWEKKCQNGMCYNMLRRCDGRKDCADGSDEDDCGPFVCSNGEEVPSFDAECNRIVECSDLSDEISCGDCKTEEFRFLCNNGVCLEKFKQCNGVDDCHDNSDEVGCDYHTCDDGQSFVIQKYKYGVVMCEGKVDCDDMSDELGCECWAYTFKCPNGMCKLNHRLCDGINDCLDNWDETVGCNLS